MLPLSRQLSKYCTRPWAFRQLAVGDAIRRRIFQYRHGFGYARSATMMDDTLTSLSLEPMKMVHKTQSQVIESNWKVGSPLYAWKETRKSRELSDVPVCVS